MPSCSYSNQCEFVVFSCIEQPIWQSILTFSPKCQKLFIIQERTTSLSKAFLVSILWKPLTILGKITGRQSLDGSIHLLSVIKKKIKKVRLRLGKSLHASLAEMLFLLESVGTSDGPPLARMSKNNIIFPDSCWIEGKGYLFKLLKHEAKCS